MMIFFPTLCRAVNNIFQGFAYVYNGNEPNLASCQSTGSYTDENLGIALTCGGFTGPTAGAASIISLSAYIVSLFSAGIATYFCM